MRKAMVTLLFVIVLILYSCLPPYAEIDDDAYLDYVGKWQLIEIQYQELYQPDSTDILDLYSDRTFNSTFSYYLDQDTMKNEVLLGNWDVAPEMDGRTASYISIALSTDSLSEIWKVRGSTNDGRTIMNWYEPSFNASIVIFKWLLIETDTIHTQ